jgi:translocation and assembly module TamA
VTDPRRCSPCTAIFRRYSRLLIAVALLCCVISPAEAQIRVEIAGVDDEIEANIRASLDLVRYGARRDLSEAAVRRLFNRARGQIREAMHPYGYYRPRVDRTLEPQEEGWLARFDIEPGIPVQITELDVHISGEGAAEPRLLEVLADTPMEVGRRLRHQEFDRLRSNLQSAAATLGYFEAKFAARRLEVDPVEHSARGVLHLETGPRYRFGAVQLEQDILDEDLLQRIVAIRAGEPYDANKLLQSQYRLTDSRYFATVVVDAGAANPETRSVPVTIEATPARRQRIRTGIGYATDSRLRGSLGIDWRRLNSAGHSAGTELRLSEVFSELSAVYQIPIGDPIKERLLFRAAMTDQELGDIESRRTTLGVSHITLRGGGWQRNLFTDILDERTELPDDPNFRDTLIVPGIGMEKLIADDILYPTEGFRLRGELRGSHGALGASSDFLRLEFEANRVASIGERWRFFARSKLGLGLVDRFGTLPASQRFFAGGDQSVRGYDLNALGPKDDLGNTIGGRHLAFGSLEAERQIYGRFAVAVFADAGNAMDDFKDGIEASAGLGLHIRTPIGTVRIEAARSVTESRGVRLHLTIRPDL